MKHAKRRKIDKTSEDCESNRLVDFMGGIVVGDVSSTGWSRAWDAPAAWTSSLHVQVSLEYPLSVLWDDNFVGVGRSWGLAAIDSSEFGGLCTFPDNGCQHSYIVGHFYSWPITVVRLAIRWSHFVGLCVPFGTDPMGAPYHRLSISS
jgi:hypothetical protein